MKGRGLLIGLLASVALNLFLVGLGVGAWALGPRLMQPAPVVVQGRGRPALPMWALGRSLSPEYRPAFNTMLRKTLMGAAGDIREARALKRQAFDAMAAGNYDAARVGADLDRARQLEFGARQRIDRDVVAYAATLPQAERANLSNALRAMMKQPGRRAGRPQWDRAAPSEPEQVQPAPRP